MDTFNFPTRKHTCICYTFYLLLNTETKFGWGNRVESWA